MPCSNFVAPVYGARCYKRNGPLQCLQHRAALTETNRREARMAVISPITVARFWSKVSVTPSDNDCWVWNGSRKGKGYGHFRLPVPERQTHGAHRIAFLLSNGHLPPEGHVVRHKCDNPICVNPYHLEHGTKADNARDMVERGRCPIRDQSGEKNGAAKLSNAQVAEIRVRIARGEANTKIAKDYGVTHQLISRIKRGRSWAETRA